jgi:hypothetical protein
MMRREEDTTTIVNSTEDTRNATIVRWICGYVILAGQFHLAHTEERDTGQERTLIDTNVVLPRLVNQIIFGSNAELPVEPML